MDSPPIPGSESAPHGAPFSCLPTEFNELRHRCPACQESFEPPWFKKRKGEIVPIKPLRGEDGAPYNGPGRWIPLSVGVPCPKCQHVSQIDLPIQKARVGMRLYGDEAMRTL